MPPQQAQDQDPLEEVDIELDDQPAHASKTAHLRMDRSQRKQGGKKRVLVIVAAAVLGLALLGGGAYWLFVVRSSGEESSNVDTASSEQQSEMPSQPQLSPAEAAQLETYKNDALKLELTHRRDWTVRESSETSEVILTSPPVAYETSDGMVPESRGVFTLRIRVGAADETTRDSIESTAAVRESELIAYSAPTEAQRHYTNISYAGVDDDFLFFIVTGSTALKPGDPLAGKLSLSSESNYLIAGGFGEDEHGVLDYDAVPQNEMQSEVFKQATAIVESLKIF